jgi:hypothetical protein
MEPFDLDEVQAEMESEEASNFSLPIEPMSLRIVALFVLVYVRYN